MAATITPITDIPTALAAVQAFSLAYGSKLSAALQAALSAAASPSPVVTICDTAEILYAGAAGISDAPSAAAAQTLCAQLAGFGTMNAWHGLAANGRGSGIVQSMSRQLGVTPPAGMSWPAASADPAVDTRFTALVAS